LIGVADEDDVPDARRQLNQQLADRLGVPMLSNLAEALQRDDVHAVSICAEPFRRGRIIVEAARAGKHLYLDKPLAGSLEDAHAVVAAVVESGVVAHMFTQVNWDPAQRVKEILESGEIGELVAIHSDVCFAKGHGGRADLSKPRVESEVPTRFELPDAKREFTNVGVYPVAMLLWLLRKNVRRVDAVTRNFFFAEHQANDMEDFGQMLMEFEGGVTATITAGRAGWRSHPGFGLHRVCVIGTKASVTVDAHRPRVEVWADVEPWSAPPRDPGDPMGMWAALPDSPYNARPKESWIMPREMAWADDAKHFLDCIEQGKQSQISVDIAAVSTEILLAAYRSAATNQAVALPLASSR
jgi:predicted dehydrogenase